VYPAGMSDTSTPPVGGPTNPDASPPVLRVGGPTDPDASPFDPRLLIQAIKDRRIVAGAGDSLCDLTSADIVYPVQVTRGDLRQWGLTNELPGASKSCRISEETIAELAACDLTEEGIALRGHPKHLVRRLSNGLAWAVLESAMDDAPTPPVSMR